MALSYSVQAALDFFFLFFLFSFFTCFNVMTRLYKNKLGSLLNVGAMQVYFKQLIDIVSHNDSNVKCITLQYCTGSENH